MAKNVIINGVVYNSVPEVQIPVSGGDPGEKATFYDTSDADATQGDVIVGKTYYDCTGKKVGGMTNYGYLSESISTKDQVINIYGGFYSSGQITIDPREARKIIAENIKSGVTILGVSGSSTVVDTTVNADAADASTVYSGRKAFVNGSLITGQMTVPTVSQDSTTKVLSIS